MLRERHGPSALDRSGRSTCICAALGGALGARLGGDRPQPNRPRDRRRGTGDGRLRRLEEPRSARRRPAADATEPSSSRSTAALAGGEQAIVRGGDREGWLAASCRTSSRRRSGRRSVACFARRISMSTSFAARRARQAGVELPEPVKLRRVTWWSLVQIALLALARLDSSAGSTGSTTTSFGSLLSDAAWGWVAFGFVFAQLPRVSQAIATLGSVPAKLPFPGLRHAARHRLHEPRAPVQPRADGDQHSFLSTSGNRARRPRSLQARSTRSRARSCRPSCSCF